MTTHYDRKRNELRDKMSECVDLAKELVIGDHISGYEEMNPDYAVELFITIKKARDLV